MTITRRCVIAAAGFLILEALLIGFVDRPLSEMLRTVDVQNHSLINFFRDFTDFGKSKWYLWPSAFGVLVCAILVRQKSLAQRIRKNAKRIGEGLLFLFICGAASGIVADIIKRFLGRARPVELDRNGLYEFRPFTFNNGHWSMPSGHTTDAFALAFVVAGFFPRLRIPAFLFAVAIAVSRIMVNAHFLSDVLAGGMVAFLTVSALRRPKSQNGIFHINQRIFPIDGKSAAR